MTLPPLLLILIVVAYRLISASVGYSDNSWLPNFAPLAAIALCGAAFLPRHLAFTVPLAALLVSDLLLNFLYAEPLFSPDLALRFALFGGTAWLGWKMREKPKLPQMLGGAIISASVFYVATNTAAWFSNPAYLQTVGGWTQALTSGLPGFPPTILFFRNSLASDLLFTTVAYASFVWGKSHVLSPDDVSAGHPAMPLPAVTAREGSAL